MNSRRMGICNRSGAAVRLDRMVRDGVTGRLMDRAWADPKEPPRRPFRSERVRPNPALSTEQIDVVVTFPRFDVETGQVLTFSNIIGSTGRASASASTRGAGALGVGMAGVVAVDGTVELTGCAAAAIAGIVTPSAVAIAAPTGSSAVAAVSAGHMDVASAVAGSSANAAVGAIKSLIRRNGFGRNGFGHGRFGSSVTSQVP